MVNGQRSIHSKVVAHRLATSNTQPLCRQQLFTPLPNSAFSKLLVAVHVAIIGLLTMSRSSFLPRRHGPVRHSATIHPTVSHWLKVHMHQCTSMQICRWDPLYIGRLSMHKPETIFQVLNPSRVREFISTQLIGSVTVHCEFD